MSLPASNHKASKVVVSTQAPVAASKNAVSKAATAAASTPAIARGDLKAGSLTRLLDAGEQKLPVTYWTTQNPTTWTADESVAVQLSAHIENGDTLHAIKVTRFLATLDDGTTLATIRDDQGEFVITPPFSYSSVLTVRPADRTASSATVSVEFDLLVETAPRSGEFFRQTVLDTVHLSFAEKGPAR